MIKIFRQKLFNIVLLRNMNKNQPSKSFSTDSNNGSCPVTFQQKNEIYPHHFVSKNKK